MSLSVLREQVCQANLDLVAAGLVSLSFGNASGVDRDSGVIAIKPSGVDYAALKPDDIVLVGLSDGRVVEGSLRPSSDTPTHLALYRRFGPIGGVVHTHSPFAVAWAQAGRSIPCLGTTHADHFAGAIPVTRSLSDSEISGEYELETGAVIVETMIGLGLEPLAMPGALVASHGPFTWGSDARDAARNAIALEIVAAMAYHTVALEHAVEPIGASLLAKHFARKHGPSAYYGQPDP
jgi:L-ribulose-5-phosphate 4-epimerase